MLVVATLSLIFNLVSQSTQLTPCVLTLCKLTSFINNTLKDVGGFPSRHLRLLAAETPFRYLETAILSGTI